MTTTKITKKRATVNKQEGKPEMKKLTQDEVNGKIAGLLKRLEATSLTNEKKVIRRNLRSLGHSGGLKK